MGVLKLSLADILLRQPHLLDRLLGKGTYQIEEGENDVAKIRTEWMELTLVYDSRDRFVSSRVKALKVPAEISENCTTDTLLRFCGIEVGARRKSDLDEQQVSDELAHIQPFANLLKDEQTSRDAILFFRGYCAAYTDCLNGKWH